MKKPIVKRTLIAVGILALVGSVGAQAYYTHELAQRVSAQQPIQTQTGQTPLARNAPAVQIDPHDPFVRMHADIARMQQQMDQMFNSAFQVPSAFDSSDQQAARVTLDEQGDNYVVKATIPGATEKDINVNLDGRLLSISSSSQGDQKQTADNGQVLSQEHYTSSFQQAFSLPGPVNASKMKTHFDDGVLTVTIPKLNS
jgi:HSP20 family protein